MFATGFVTLLFVALFAAVNVAGYPVPEPFRRALAAERGPAPFEPIQAYINRDFHADRGTVPDDVLMKRDTAVNTIPEEDPTKAPNGELQPYVKRQDINTIPEEEATKAPNGQIQPYVKRQDVNNS